MTATASATTEKPAKRKRFRITRTRLAGLFVPVLLVVAGFASVSDVDAARSGPLGLIEVMPASYFAVVALLVVSFVTHFRRQVLDVPVLAFHVVALIVLLHGTVSFIEQNPRFPVVYTHIGLTEYIQRTGETLPSLDARMNWPGFFTAAAMLDDIAGTDSIFPFLLWAPLVQNLFYAPLIYVIARTASTDVRIPWLTLWIYFTLSWVGQDYFAPQALNFLFFLAFMAVVLRCFRTDRAALPRPLRRTGNAIARLVSRIVKVDNFEPGGAPILATTTVQRALLVAALAAIYGASVMSHQLTPVFLLLFVTTLVVLRRTVLRGFPLLMAVIFFSYISYGAIGYWSGHINDLFGGFGKLGGLVKDNVGNKVQVHTSHVYVVYARLMLAGGVWALAVAGLVRRLRAGRADLAPLAGFVVPFLVLGGQSYGGEVILRVFLFTLPFSSIFLAFLALPTERSTLSVRRSMVLALAGILLVPVFWLTRFGNEAFEYVSKQNYEGALELARIAPEDSALLSLDSNTGNQVGRMEQFAYIGVPPYISPEFKTVDILNIAINAQATRAYLFLDRAQVSNIELTTGKPKTFFDDITNQLVASGRFQVVYSNLDARIFLIDTSTPLTPEQVAQLTPDPLTGQAGGGTTSGGSSPATTTTTTVRATP